MPRVVLRHFSSGEDTAEEIDQENELRSKSDERGDRNEHIHTLLRDQEIIFRRIVKTPHLAADAKDVHWEKDAIDADEADPEMNLAQRLVHEPAEHFREPEI